MDRNADEEVWDFTGKKTQKREILSLAEFEEDEKLEFVSEQIKILQPFDGLCAHLISLDLEDNYLTEIPRCFESNLPVLKVLTLTRNRLTILQHVPVSVEHLYCSSNAISEISVAKLSRLKVIRLAKNQLTMFPENLAFLESIESISLFQNKIQTLQDALLQRKNPRLKFLDLSHNEIICDFYRKVYSVFENCLIDFSIPDQIAPWNIFLGNEFCLHNKAFLRKFGISHILSICHGVSEIPGMTHLILPLNDDLETQILPHFHRTFGFIDDCLEGGDGKIFIHCSAGVSRSSSFLIAYLMRKFEWSFAAALEHVKAHRSCACPNANFEAQLLEYEKVSVLCVEMCVFSGS
jgi:hypothetical protein